MTDFQYAAKKNLRDACILFENERFDGASYLAGYVIECIFKTIIQVEKRSLSFTHNIDELGNDARKFAASPNAKTHKYHGRMNIAVGYADTPLEPPAGWKETLRYYPEGTMNQVVAKVWLNEAQNLYSRVITKMALDGVIKI